MADFLQQAQDITLNVMQTERLRALRELGKTPEFQAMPVQQQTLEVRKYLGNDPFYQSRGPADRALMESTILQGLSAGPTVEKGLGALVQEVGMETVLPAAAGIGGAALGALAGGSASIPAAAVMTAGAGQLAEYTRPLLTGEPMRTPEEMAGRRLVEMGSSVAADVVGPALLKVGEKTPGFVAKVVKKSLGIAGKRPLKPEAIRAQRVFRAGGTEIMPHQMREPDTGGVLATIEDIALNTSPGRRVRATREAQQLESAEAYLHNLTDDYVKGLDADDLSQFITQAIVERDTAATHLKNGLFAEVDAMIPDWRIQLDDWIKPIREDYASNSQFQKALGHIIPEAFDKTAKAATRGAQGQLLPAFQPSTAAAARKQASRAVIDSFPEAADRLSQLHRVARETDDQAVANIANRAARDLEAMMTEKMPAEAAEQWEVARNFVRDQKEKLGNDFIGKLIWQASESQQKGDTFMRQLFSPQNADNAAALKRALTETIGEEGAAASLPALAGKTNAWERYVRPAIQNNLLRKVYDAKDQLIGKPLLNALKEYSPKGVNKILGPGYYSALKDLGSAIDVAINSTPGRAKLWAANTAENRALFSIVGLGRSVATLPATVPAAVGIAVLPGTIAKALESPSIMRMLAASLRNPGPKGKLLAATITKLVALKNKDDITDAALEYAYKSLQETNQWRRKRQAP